MSKTTTIFAKWDLICDLVIGKYIEKLSLPSDFRLHFDEQFRILINKDKNKSIKNDLLNSKANSNSNKVPSNVIQAKIDLGLKNKEGLDDNQFITVSNSENNEFIWIDDRITSVLNISKAKFSMDGILGIDKNLNLHHPMDVSHYARYRTLAYFINSLKGINFSPFKDYYSVKFKIGVDGFKSKENINSSTKLVHKKCYGLMDENEILKKGTGRKDDNYHLDVWTISNYHEKQNYVSYNFEIIDNALMTKFVNVLFYMTNAKILGFYPKELLVLHYLNSFDTTEESRSRINRKIRLKSSAKCEFENKAFTDFSYLLNKKLTKAVIKLSLNSEHNTQYFNSLNRLTKARKLGLLPLPNELEETFLTTVCNS